MVAKRDFTDRFLKAIRPAPPGKRVVIYDAQVPGFGIRVGDRSTADNKGAFVLITRFPGSANPAPRRIGDYPAMSLGKAREVAREWREDIRRGVDPKIKEAEQRREQERRRADTFAAAFEQFADDHLSTLRTGAAVRAAVETHVFPKLAERPMREIKRREILNLLQALKKQLPIGVNRVRAYLSTFFLWAVNHEIIDDSPVASIKRLSKEAKRARVLENWEILAIWQACEDLGAFGRAFRFMLVTGQRRTEVGALTWSEIDRKEAVWTLSEARTKAKRVHKIPLSDLALSIIEGCPKLGDFVFSTGRSALDKSRETLSVRPISGWGKAKRRLDELALKRAQKIREQQEGDETPIVLAEWRLHDLRRTCATNLGRLRVERLVISKVLNHAEKSVTGTYDVYEYFDEKKQALDLWARRLTTIVGGNAGGKVVSIARGART